MNKLTILCPNGHLSYAPIEEGSYRIGLKRKPDAICADAGSCDIGPHSLGTDTSVSLERFQRHDIELMLKGSRELGVPMVIGSANDTGTNKGVDKFVRIIKEIASKEHLPPFKLASIHSSIDLSYIREQLNAGKIMEGLNGRPSLTKSGLERTDNIVAVMGVEPILRALKMGADVVVTSRTSDCCIFAAVALANGFAPAYSYYLGKVLECASFCAEPYMGKESVLGTITQKEVFVEAMHPDQRCTPASVAGHAMYERMDPFRETFAGGYIEMSDCCYEQYDEKTTRVTGVKYHKSDSYCVKLEGAGKVGERAYAIAGVRDSDTVRNIDKAVNWAKNKVKELYGESGKDYHIFYHIYGKNGVMGEMEPVKEIKSHELGIVVEVVANTKEEALAIVTTGLRGIFYARLKTKGTAGGAAFLTENALYAGLVCEWTVNHVIEIGDPYSHFPITMEEIK